MGSRLPYLSEARFRKRLLGCFPTCPDTVPETLYPHYQELRRWNPRLSLIGPGTAHEVVERHYGESLAALPLLDTDTARVLDIGSGAGFPGLVLSAALPSLRVILAESRSRKWAFLRAAVRRCGLSSQCLNVRVEPPLAKLFPHGIDVVTCRGVSLSTGLLEALCESFPGLRLLLWCGADVPEIPEVCRVKQELALPGSSRRRILELQAGAA